MVSSTHGRGNDAARCIPEPDGRRLETTPPQHELRRKQTLTLSLLFAAGLINFFDRASLSVANNTIRAQMHLNAVEMGWLLSAFSLAYGFAQLPLVGLIQRFGVRSALGGGRVLWSAAQSLTSLVGGLPSFLALRVVLGIGESPFYPCGVQSVRDWFAKDSRGRATAVMSMSQTLGLAAAPPLLAWLLLRVGWRHTFALLGISGLLVADAWIAFYRSPEQAASDATPAAAGLQKDLLRTLLRQRMVWGMMLGFGGVNYTNWLYTAWVPGYLQPARQLSLARTGWVSAIPFLAGAAGMAASGSVADRFSQRGESLTRVHRRNLVVGMVLSALSTFLVAHSPSTVTAVSGISVALFFIHFAGTSGWGYAQAVSRPEWVASLSALQNFASFVIASAAPVITGWLLDRTHSFTLALGLCSAITLLGALSYATLARPRGTVPSDSQPWHLA